MFKRNFLTGIFASGLLIGLVALAHGAFNDSTQIVLDDGFHDLGDFPKPTFFIYNVNLDTNLLAGSRTVHLEVTVLNGSHARVVINGHMLRIPDSGDLDSWEGPETGATVMSLPLAYFQSGDNAIVFESGRGFWSSTNVYDDYRFGDVVLIFSH